jgi:hypothetical protein
MERLHPPAKAPPPPIAKFVQTKRKAPAWTVMRDNPSVNMLLG